MRALGQCRLRKPQNVVASLHRVENALICKSAQVTRRDHANLRAKLARNNCKIPEILARRAQRNCLNSASMRCVSRIISLQVLTESDMRPNAKKVRAWRRCQANFAPNSREEFLRKSGAPREQRLRALGQRALRMLKNVAEVDRVENAFRSEKARVRRRDRAKVAPKSRKRVVKVGQLNNRGVQLVDFFVK